MYKPCTWLKVCPACGYEQAVITDSKIKEPLKCKKCKEPYKENK